MKERTFALALTFLCVTPVGAEIVFQDDFESGDFKKTNSAGFSWSSPNRTSIVRDDQYVVNGSSPKSGLIAGRQWEGTDGKHAMRFRYVAGQAMSEQRYKLGGAYKDLWVSYDLRVPINFRHGSGNSNNKMAAFWMDGYEVSGNAKGATAVWQIRNNGNGGSNSVIYHLESDTTGRSWSDRHSGEKQSKPFISYPGDQGRWMTVVYHLKAASSSSSKDGSLEMWRKWEDQGNFTKIHEMTNLNIPAPSSGPNGWSAGYIQGWANSAYSSNTEWLVDQFTVSTTSLLGSGSNSTPKEASPPKAPIVGR